MSASEESTPGDQPGGTAGKPLLQTAGEPEDLMGTLKPLTKRSVSVPNPEKKIAVYLAEIDWRAVVACLYAQTAESPLNAKTCWAVGKNRLHFIAEQIVAKLPKPTV